MRNTLILLMVALIVAGGYGYNKNPNACQKLGRDVVSDTTAIFAPPAPDVPPAPLVPSVAPAPQQYPMGFVAPAPPTPPVPTQTTPAPQPAQALPAAAQDPQATAITDNLLPNGDFSAGNRHWEGDGRDAGKALLVELKGDSWTKISQDFRGKGTTDTVTVIYKVSGDLSASVKAEDYANVIDLIRFEDYAGYGRVDLPIGDFLVWIGDLTNHASRYEMYSLKPTMGDTQTIQHTFPSGAADVDKTVTLAFPPGTGSVTILSVSVKSN